MTGLLLATVLSVSPRGATLSDEDDTGWARTEEASRSAPALLPYLGVGALGGGVVGFGLGYLAVQQGFLLGGPSGFGPDFRVATTPFAFGLLGAGLGAAIGWAVWGAHLADFQASQHSRVALFIAPPLSDSGWRFAVSARF